MIAEFLVGIIATTVNPFATGRLSKELRITVFPLHTRADSRVLRRIQDATEADDIEVSELSDRVHSCPQNGLIVAISLHRPPHVGLDLIAVQRMRASICACPMIFTWSVPDEADMGCRLPGCSAA